MASNGPITLAAPVIDSIMPPPDKWTREYEAFRRMLPELLRTHRGQYVAIHEGRVIASGPDKLAAALEAFRQSGNVPIHVGLVTDEPERTVRSGIRRVLPPAGAAW